MHLDCIHSSNLTGFAGDQTGFIERQFKDFRLIVKDALQVLDESYPSESKVKEIVDDLITNGQAEFDVAKGT